MSKIYTKAVIAAIGCCVSQIGLAQTQYGVGRVRRGSFIHISEWMPGKLVQGHIQ